MDRKIRFVDQNSPENQKFKELLAKIHRVPSVPSLYLELVELMNNPGVALADVSAVITKDMAMTAIILGLANSAYFGLKQRVSDPAEATIYLGVDTIRMLVLSIHSFSQFKAPKIDGFSAEMVWAHSLETAHAANAIARLEGAGQRLIDDAFVGGMLHDIGKLVLADNFPKQYQEVFRLIRASKMEHRQAERDVFGATHADVAGWLLGSWDLPLAVVQAIASHHEPGRTGQKLFSPLTAVHAANALVHEFHDTEALFNDPLDMEYLEKLGLAERPEVWREELAKNLAELTASGVLSPSSRVATGKKRRVSDYKE